MFEPVTLQTAAHTALVILAMVSMTVLGLAVRQRLSTDSLMPSIVTGVAGLLTAGGAAAVWRWWPGRADMVDGLGWIALPLLTVSVAGGAPGHLGAAHVFIAALAGAVLTCGIATATGRHANVAATVVTVLGLGGAVAAVRMWWPVPAQWLGMCALGRPAAAADHGPDGRAVGRADPAAVLRVDHRTRSVPSQRRSAGRCGVAGRGGRRRGSKSDTTPRGAQIAVAAVRANNVLTGICVGAGLTLPVAVWATLMPGHDRSMAAAVLAGLFVVIFTSRGRAFADKRQAVALVCGAAAAMCVGVVKYVVHEPVSSGYPMLWGALVLVGFGGAGLLAALLVPITSFTPLVRMIAEWVEIAAIIAALPLAAWIGGLFTWVRMR